MSYEVLDGPWLMPMSQLRHGMTKACLPPVECAHVIAEFRSGIAKMTQRCQIGRLRTFMKALRSPAAALILMVCSALGANSAGKTYFPKNADEVEVISLVLTSEARANNWTKDDLIYL